MSAAIARRKGRRQGGQAIGATAVQEETSGGRERGVGPAAGQRAPSRREARARTAMHSKSWTACLLQAALARDRSGLDVPGFLGLSGISADPEHCSDALDAVQGLVGLDTELLACAGVSEDRAIGRRTERLGLAKVGIVLAQVLDLVLQALEDLAGRELRTSIRSKRRPCRRRQRRDHCSTKPAHAPARPSRSRCTDATPAARPRRPRGWAPGRRRSSC